MNKSRSTFVGKDNKYIYSASKYITNFIKENSRMKYQYDQINFNSLNFQKVIFYIFITFEGRVDCLGRLADIIKQPKKTLGH